MEMVDALVAHVVHIPAAEGLLPSLFTNWIN